MAGVKVDGPWEDLPADVRAQIDFRNVLARTLESGRTRPMNTMDAVDRVGRLR